MADPEAKRREPWPLALGAALAGMIGVCIAFWWIATTNPDVEIRDSGARPGLAPAGESDERGR